MPYGVYKRTDLHREILSKAHIGKKLSKETRLRMSEAKKGKKRPEETCLKISKSHKGKKLSDEHKAKLSIAFKGSKSNFWKGGVSVINNKIRGSLKYRLWREAVFKRDKWTCVICKCKNGEGKAIVMNADHIKPFADFPELRFDINNGRTLCENCHRKTDTWGRNKKINK